MLGDISTQHIIIKDNTVNRKNYVSLIETAYYVSEIIKKISTDKTRGFISNRL